MVIKRNVDSIGSEDMLRPEIKLIQNTGGDQAKAVGAKPGQFFNVTSGEIYTDGFEFVVLDFSIQRVYWGRDVLGDEPPMCSSLNAQSYESVNGDDCKKCEHLCDNAAMVDAKSRREKCTKQYSFMGLLLPNLEPFQFRAAGTSSTAIQSLITRFRYNKACWNADKTGIDFHRFKVSVTAREEKTKSGSAYVIKFGEITPLQDQAFEQELLLTSAQMLGQSVELIPEKTGPGTAASKTFTEDEEATALRDIESATAPTDATPPTSTPAPKVTNVSPPAPSSKPPTPAASKPKINLDI